MDEQFAKYVGKVFGDQSCTRINEKKNLQTYYNSECLLYVFFKESYKLFWYNRGTWEAEFYYLGFCLSRFKKVQKMGFKFVKAKNKDQRSGRGW